MKKIFFIISVIIGLSATLAAQDGRRHTEDRNVGVFYGVKATIGIEVKIIQSPRHSVSVEVYDPQFLDRIETYVEKGMLYVKYSFKINESIHGRNIVYVHAPELREISAVTGASVEIEDTFEGDHLKIMAGTGSDISGKIKFKSLDLVSKLGSDITLTGKADVCIALATGGSTIEIASLKCREVTATAKGGSDIEVYASDKVDLKSNGGSDITYYGEPKVRNIRSSVSSDISRGRN